jgi:hypothetical protein
LRVKSDKTFEDIVERLAALFKLKPRPGDQDFGEAIEITSSNLTPTAPKTAKASASVVCFPKNKK